jgi:stage II sporulation protein D
MEQMWIKTDSQNIIKITVLCLLGLAAFVFCFIDCGEAPVFREEAFSPQIRQPAVKVKLLETKHHIRVGSIGSFVIRCFPHQGDPIDYYAAADLLVESSPDGLRLGQRSQGELEAGLLQVSFFPKEEGLWLYLNGKTYRGALEISQSEKTGSLLALNLVHVEDYLKGVVPAEIGELSAWEMEALKAQAVVARTYSLSRMERYQNKGYDLEATVADQVYLGVVGETPLANEAVEATKGEVLTYNGELICAYYHANSGGRTEHIDKVWDQPGEDYLIPVNDRFFCSWSQNYKWKESWSKQALQRNLKRFFSSGVDLPYGRFGDVVNLRVRKRSSSGRVEVLDVVTDWGTYRVRKDKIRWALRKGSNCNSILPSTCFDLDIIRDQEGLILQVIARGRGNGHGVGMCQIGAIGMARKGYSHQDILWFYYSGAKLTPGYGKSNPQEEKLAISDTAFNSAP